MRFAKLYSTIIINSMLVLRIVIFLFILITDFQSATGVSVAASVDIEGPTSHVSRSEPATAVTGPGVRTAPTQHDRLTQTAPGALTYPLSGRFVHQLMLVMPTLSLMLSFNDFVILASE